MRPYQIKSAEKKINNEPLDGWAVYCNGEQRYFVNAYQIRAAQDFVNHLNDGFDIYDKYMREKNEAR